MSPIKAVLEDGTEVEVPTDEEKKEAEDALKEKDAETTKEIEDLKVLNKDLEDGSNPNWPEVRAKLDKKKKLEKALKEKGLSLDEEGQLVDDPSKNQVTPEEVKKTSEEIIDEKLRKNHIDSKLLNYDEETRKVIKAKYDKLATGEELGSLADVDNLLKEAITLGAPGQPLVDPTRTGGIHSGPPKFEDDKGISETTKEMGQDFGLQPDDYDQSGDVAGLLLNKNNN